MLSSLLALAACDSEAGKDGAAGTDGAAGENGADGTNGENGADGENGEDGEPGTDAGDTDADGDGVNSLVDCDDDDPAVGGPTTHYIDYDGDTYGFAGVTSDLCAPLTGWVDNDLDCDDLDATISPDAAEVCDMVDNDCDGDVDMDDDNVDLTGAVDGYLDLDGDGFGDEFLGTTAVCAGTVGYSDIGGDCDDGASAVNPDAEEVCGNGVDDNCNGSPDACGLSGTTSTSEAVATVSGSTSDYLGNTLAVGDFNGDSIDDVLLGEQYGNSDYGAGYVLYGGVSYQDINITTNYNARFSGASTYNYLGKEVTSGDWNGDGYDDIALAEYGTDSAWISYGSASGWSGDYTTASMDAQIVDTADYYLGYAVKDIGDMNGDGLSDLYVGAYGETSSDYGVGRAYVFFGTTSGRSGAVDASDNADAIITNDNDTTYDYFGIYNRTVTGDDFDGDGASDLAVGAYGDDTFYSSGGRVFVFMGSTTAGGALGSYSADTTFDTDSSSGDSYFGYSVDAVPDLNGDGYADLAVGGQWYDGAAYDAGIVAVFYGASTGWASSLDIGDADMTVTGMAASDYLGANTGHIDDPMGTGFSSLVATASGADPGSVSSAGAAYVFHGATSLGGAYTASQADITINGDASSDYMGSFGIGSGDLDDDGITELFIGAYGAEKVYAFSLGGF